MVVLGQHCIMLDQHVVLNVTGIIRQKYLHWIVLNHTNNGVLKVIQSLFTEEKQNNDIVIKQLQRNSYWSKHLQLDQYFCNNLSESDQ